MGEGDNSRTLSERNYERATGEDVDVARRRPLSDLHQKIRDRNNGRVPVRCSGDSSDVLDGEEAYKEAMKIPWYERVRKFYHMVFN